MLLQVLGADTPTFKLHITPRQPETPRNQFAKAISHAGHGMGLQVFPGSIAEVVHVNSVMFAPASISATAPARQATAPADIMRDSLSGSGHTLMGY